MPFVCSYEILYPNRYPWTKAVGILTHSIVRLVELVLYPAEMFGGILGTVKKRERDHYNTSTNQYYCFVRLLLSVTLLRVVLVRMCVYQSEV